MVLLLAGVPLFLSRAVVEAALATIRVEEMQQDANTGVVRNLRRGEQSGAGLNDPGDRQQVLSFRLERAGPDGDIAGYVAVEMRGEIFYGDIAEGDTVVVQKGRYRNGTLRAITLQNVTTKSLVHVSNRPWLKLIKILLAVTMVLVFLVVGYFMISSIPSSRFP